MTYPNMAPAYPSAARPMLDWSSMDNWGTQGAGAAPVSSPAAASSVPIIEKSIMAAPRTGMTAAGGQPGFFDNMLGYRAADGTHFDGWGGLALGGASTLMGGYLGFQQLGVAKDQLAQSKKQFEINFGANQKLTNARLADRQAARVSANPNAYESVSSYMAKNGI